MIQPSLATALACSRSCRFLQVATADLLGHDGVTRKPMNQMSVDYALGVLDVWKGFVVDLAS